MFYFIGIIFSIIFGLICTKHLYFIFKKILWGSDILRMQLISVGKWAVITGATDGIGKAYVEYFAEKNFNIFLISRNQEKLNHVASEIEEKYNVETKTIAVDFTKGYAIYMSIKEAIKPIEEHIGILVNNVGMSYQYPEYYLNIENLSEFTQNIINCNIISVNMMTELILPSMLEQGCGIIINVSSTAAKIPNPMLAIYAATKAYVCKFTEDLFIEYEPKGISIQCLLPGIVQTNMTKLKKSSLISPTPKEYVQNAAKTIGIESLTTGYYIHTIQLFLFQLMAFFVPELLNIIFLKMMQTLNVKNLQKLKKS